MARKKKEIIINGASGTIKQKSAFTLYDYIQQYYAAHPDVYAGFLAWKAAKHETAAAQ